MLHGFLNLAKPAGITSHDAVARVRRIAGQQRVGHAGTLDPAATGVLPLALGQATRLVEYLADAHKGYRATIALGQVTDTDDAEGQIIDEQQVPELSEELLQAAILPFVGQIMQVPPAYSALHHQGRRLYELAREGIAPELPARPVTIERITLLAYHPPLLTIDVACGKGTYIRSLARDIGASLGCGAHLQTLVRTFVGAFSLTTAVPLDALTPQLLASELHDPSLAVASWPLVVLDAPAVAALRNGQAIPANGDEQRARAHGPDATLVALLERAGDSWQPTKVFNWS